MKKFVRFLIQALLILIVVIFYYRKLNNSRLQIEELKSAVSSIEDEKSDLETKIVDLENQLTVQKEEAEENIKAEKDVSYVLGYKKGVEYGNDDGYRRGFADGMANCDKTIVRNLSFMLETKNSSCFSSVGYYEGDLYVTFRDNGRSYIYYNVPDFMWENMMNSDSIGSYFKTQIEPNCDYAKIIDGTESVEKYIYITEYDDEEAYEAGREAGEEDGYIEGYREGYKEATDGYGARY